MRLPAAAVNRALSNMLPEPFSTKPGARKILYSRF
jgi:hypothetical protein